MAGPSLPPASVWPVSWPWPPELAAMSRTSPMKAQRAWENSAYVRVLLWQRQPELAAALAAAEQYFSGPCCPAQVTGSARPAEIGRCSWRARTFSM